MPSPVAPPPPLDQSTALLSILLLATSSVKSFQSRWQVIRSKLVIRKSLFSCISESTHWLENPLLQTLLPEIVTTLRHIHMLSDQCTELIYTAEKLLMQSDLIEYDKAVTVVANEGNVRYLIQLLDVNDHIEHAVSAVSILVCTSGQSRKTVFKEGGLGLLLRILESGSIQLKEKTSIAVEAITGDIDKAWAISAYDGVPILLEVCRSGSLTAQSHGIGAIMNVASIEDIRVYLCEEAAVAVMVQLLISGFPATKEKAANCMVIVASSSKYFRVIRVGDASVNFSTGGETKLHLFRE